MSEITIASTTSTQEELNHAASENWRQPLSSTEAGEPATEAPAPETPAEENAEPETPVETDEAEEGDGKQKKKGGFQKRIDKLSRRNHELEEQLDRLNEQIRSLQDGDKSAAPATPSSEKPKLENFQSYEDYIEALTDWQAEQKLAKVQAMEVQAELEAETRARFDEYNSKIAEARGKYEDFDEVVGRDDIKIPEAAQVAIIEAGNGPDIAYYLGNNPDIAKKLCEMSPAAVAVEIGRISARLTAGETAKPAAPPPKPAPSAPAPIKPVAARGAHTSVPPDEMSYQDYRRGRQNGTIR